MKEVETYTTAGFNWDFTDIWGIDPTKNDGYPILQQSTLNGSGTASSPYIIATKTDLKILSKNTDYWAADLYFEQTADLTFDAADFAVDGDFYNGGEGFLPIGNFDVNSGMTINFEGNYNGGGFTIDGLLIGDEYPRQQAEALIRILNEAQSLQVISEYLAMFSVYNVVVKKYDFYQNQKQTTQKFKLILISDEQLELTIE